jgi:mRNA interferase RelE/StbE
MPPRRRALFGLAIGPAAAAFLDLLPAGKLRRQITRKVRALATDPRPQGCKKLKDVSSGTDSVWRVRSGDYRILYVVRSAEVIVIDIDHRKDVYS